MTSLANSMMMAAGGSLAASVLVKATIVLALGFVGAWAARRSRASLRHALLAAVFAVLAALPGASALLPLRKIVLAPERTTRPTPQAFVPRTARVSAPATTSAAPSEFDLALLLWAIGMGVSLAPVALGLWQIRRLRRGGRTWTRGELLAGQLAAQIGVRRRVEVRLHEMLHGPMTCGAVRPAILLPEEAEGWDEAALERALLHELEHVRRGDWAVQCGARVVCAAYWFHPLGWMARTRLAREAERACDDAVVERWEPAVYADQLVELAQQLSSDARIPALSMASRADLTVRVRALLDARQRRGRASRSHVALLSAAALALMFAVAPIRTVAAPQPQSYTAAGNLVVQDVQVTDANGHAVENLTASDFAVTDNGVPQTVAFCEFQKLDSTASNVLSYYVLGYYASNAPQDGAFHQIRVKVANATSARVNYRNGYYAGRFTQMGVNSGVPGGVIGGVRGGVPGGVSGGVAGRGGRGTADEAPGVFGRVGGGDGIFASGTSTSTPTAVSGQVSGSDESGVTEPVVVERVEPEYSEQARKAKYQGSVVLLVTIEASGQVTNVKVLKSLGLGLDEKAIEAALQWRFRPATKLGQPIAVQRQIKMDFRLL